MTKLKIGIATILSVLFIIIIIQNTESVSTRLLFMTVEMPRAALLFVTMLFGFVIGLLSAFTLAGKRKDQ